MKCNRSQSQLIEITYLGPSELAPYARNARTHSDAQIAQIAASITEFGFNNPILVRGGQIVAGHGRWLAAQQLGMAKVPTCSLDHLTATQARAYVLADNQLALNAGWDTDVLSDELLDLANQGVDLTLLGFGDEPEGKEVKARSIDVSTLTGGRFWLSVEGPIPQQIKALEGLKQFLEAIPGVEINTGVVG